MGSDTFRSKGFFKAIDTVDQWNSFLKYAK